MFQGRRRATVRVRREQAHRRHGLPFRVPQDAKGHRLRPRPDLERPCDGRAFLRAGQPRAFEHRRVADETGTAVILVEQHFQLALEISDHAIVLSHGVEALRGGAMELRQDPALLEAAYFGTE